MGPLLGGRRTARLWLTIVVTGSSLMYEGLEAFGTTNSRKRTRFLFRNAGLMGEETRGPASPCVWRRGTFGGGTRGCQDASFWQQQWRPIRQGYSTLALSSSSSEDTEVSRDEEEWQAVVEALKMYKTAFGDLKVPARFIVPLMPPWPEAAWGIKLGQRVAAIRQTGRYVSQQNQEDRRRILDDLGFLWRARADSSRKLQGIITLDQMYQALSTYQKHVSSDLENIPASFIVPDCEPWPEPTRGLPLGKQVPKIRTKAYLQANPGAEEKLGQLGITVETATSRSDARYQRVYTALARYKEIYGDLIVPNSFAIPKESDEWPEETWGIKLGFRVSAIRTQGTFVGTHPERKTELSELGFEWDSARAKAIEAEKRAAAVARQETDLDDNEATTNDEELEEEDDEEEEDDDEEEKDDDWLSSSAAPTPPTTTTTTEDQIGKNPLAGDGFKPWGIEDEPISQMDPKELMEQMNEYVPPRDFAETLQQAAEMAQAVGVISEVGEDFKNPVKGKRYKDIGWTIDDFGEGFDFEDVVDALTIYKNHHGNFEGLDDGEFVVPEGDQGLRISATDEIRTDVDEDEEDEYELEDYDEDEEEDLYEEDAEEYGDEDDATYMAGESQGYRDTVASGIPGEFDVLGEENEMEAEAAATSTATLAAEEREGVRSPVGNKRLVWPEHLWGMELGSIVGRMRDGSLEVKHRSDRKELLDAIDFDWGDPAKFIDIPFETAMCALYAFYQLRGDTFVDEDYVIPSEEPWPIALGGYELGAATKRIRELQFMLEAYHPVKVGMLRMLEFLWLPTVALPLDPEGEESFDDMFVEGMGHPFYHISDPSVELVDSIMEDGPWGPPEKTKSWYNYDYIKKELKDMFDVDSQDPMTDEALALVLEDMGLEQLADEHRQKYGLVRMKEMEKLWERIQNDDISDEEFEEAKLPLAKYLTLVGGDQLLEMKNKTNADDPELFLEDDPDDDDLESAAELYTAEELRDMRFVLGEEKVKEILHNNGVAHIPAMAGSSSSDEDYEMEEEEP